MVELYFAEQQQKVTGSLKSFEAADGRESSLAAFVDVSGVLLKAQFRVLGESETFEALHYQHFNY